MGRVKSKVLQHDHQRLRIRSLPPPVGEYPIEKRTDGRATEVAEKSESAAHSESEGEERAPLIRARSALEPGSISLPEAPWATTRGSLGESLYHSSHFLIIISDY
jgi:hypothetical protein